MAVLLRRLRPCLPIRFISSPLFSSPSLKPQNYLLLSPLSSLFLNSRGFVGCPRNYDAGVCKQPRSYRDVQEMADADADATTDSSEQKRVFFVYTLPREHDPVLLKASYVDMLVLLLGSKEAALEAMLFCDESIGLFGGLFEANLTGLQAKSLAGFPGVVMLQELNVKLVI